MVRPAVVGSKYRYASRCAHAARGALARDQSFIMKGYIFNMVRISRNRYKGSVEICTKGSVFLPRRPHGYCCVEQTVHHNAKRSSIAYSRRTDRLDLALYARTMAPTKRTVDSRWDDFWAEEYDDLDETLRKEWDGLYHLNEDKKSFSPWAENPAQRPQPYQDVRRWLGYGRED
jgi:hypothetical protein